MAAVAESIPSIAPQTTGASASDVQRLFELQRETALRLRTSTADERIAKLKKLKQAVQDYAPKFHASLYQDFRKSPMEVELAEILPVVAECNDMIRHVKKWMKPQRVMPTMMMGGTAAHVQHEPRGRCLIVAPWNYPVNLCFMPLASCIAAGNTAILKPSEMTPATSAVMAELIKEIFPENEIALVEGEIETSTALLDLPFDHIFFTGSPAIGKVVMAAAAKNLTSVTLELGGKSPVIVDETADLKLAAKTIMWGKYANSGQTCIAPDHVYVHESVKDEFTKLAVQALKDGYGETPADWQKNTDLTHVVNERHTRRVAGLLEDAKEHGATVLCGDVVDVADQWVAPTLLTDIPVTAKIMDEEIFGPLLPIIGYSSLDSVIGTINDGPKPLALYVWSKHKENINTVMKNTSSGGACINHVTVQYLHMNLPFGGVNNSGIGSAHGIWGFKAFSHERAVVRTQFMMARMFFPPYSKWSLRLVKLLRKFV